MKIRNSFKSPLILSKWAWKKSKPKKLFRPLRGRNSFLGFKLNHACLLKKYLRKGKVSEGLVKALTVFPLLRLAGYYQFPTELSLEEGIGRISVDDEDTSVTGRLDILAMTRSSGEYPFWVLIIESKNSAVDISVGLPQLLTYAVKSLERQDVVWGLVTNGLNYQFVVLRQGTPPTYQPMPLLPLMEGDRATQMLQVLKAIRKRPQGDSLKQTAA